MGTCNSFPTGGLYLETMKNNGLKRKHKLPQSDIYRLKSQWITVWALNCLLLAGGGGQVGVRTLG